MQVQFSLQMSAAQKRSRTTTVGLSTGQLFLKHFQLFEYFSPSPLLVYPHLVKTATNVFEVDGIVHFMQQLLSIYQFENAEKSYP